MARRFTKNILNTVSVGVGGFSAKLNGKSTVSFHAKIRPFSVEGAGTSNRIFHSWISADETGLALAIATGPPTRLRIISRSGAGNSLIAHNGTRDVPMMEWRSVGGVVSWGAGQIKIYSEGTLEISHSVSFVNATFISGGPTRHDCIGSTGNTSVPAEWFDGDIAELAIYNGDIGDAAFRSLHSVSPQMILPNQLLSYFPLLGRLSPEPDIFGNLLGVINGSAARVSHPHVSYPASLFSFSSVPTTVNKISFDSLEISVSEASIPFASIQKQASDSLDIITSEALPSIFVSIPEVFRPGVVIDGIDYNELIDWETLSVDHELGSRRVASFTYHDPTGVEMPLPEIGDTVIVRETDGVTRIFGGTLDRVQRGTALDGSPYHLIRCSCVSFEQICDRHLVSNAYENETLQEIVIDIVNTYLNEEGITTTGVDVGPTFTKVIFPYLSVTDCFNELAEISGYSWWIDEHKVLFFKNRSSVSAPFSITDVTWKEHRVADMVVDDSRDQYRNRQFIRAGTDLTDPRTEIFKGDGTVKTFNVAFPLGKVPTITVNSVSMTIGIRGVDSGKDWYWNKNYTEINQDDAATALSTTDILSVTYQGQFNLLTSMEDVLKIQQRRVAEGGSGIYEKIEDLPTIDKTTLAQETALALIARYGILPQVVFYRTDYSGLRPGMIQNISVTSFDINADYLIRHINIKGNIGWPFRYRVTAVSGYAVGGWVQFFQRLAASRRQFGIRENEQLQALRVLSDSLSLIDDGITIITHSPPRTRVGPHAEEALVGYGEVGIG